MEQKNSLKYILLALIIAAGLAFFACLVISLRGEWVDSAVSKIMSRQSGFAVNCTKASLALGPKVSFDRLSVGYTEQQQFLESGPGSVTLAGKPFLGVDLQEVHLVHNKESSRLFSFLPISRSLGGDLKVNRLRAGWRGSRSDGFLRLFECDAKNIVLKGGLILKDQQVLKAHFILLLSPERLKKIPKELSRRMIPAKNGWSAVRIIFYQDQITLSGPKGPLFQAEWQV